MSFGTLPISSSCFLTNWLMATQHVAFLNLLLVRLKKPFMALSIIYFFEPTDMWNVHISGTSSSLRKRSMEKSSLPDGW